MNGRPGLTDGRLRLAIPNKGRLAEPAIALLREAGYRFEADDRRLFASADIVVHSAAAVSFEQALDSAVEVNLLGPVRVAELLRKEGSSAHLIAVSTASEPPLVKNTRLRSPGASAAIRAASLMAGGWA